LSIIDDVEVGKCIAHGRWIGERQGVGPVSRQPCKEEAGCYCDRLGEFEHSVLHYRPKEGKHPCKLSGRAATIQPSILTTYLLPGRAALDVRASLAPAGTAMRTRIAAILAFGHRRPSG
jgi:hypothetical protein